MTQLNQLFDRMWTDYCQMNPQAQAVFDALTKAGEPVVNDHIAFRTFSHPLLTIDILARHFLNLGYKQVAEYRFDEKKLKAKHYESPQDGMPLVFISELDLNQMPQYVRAVVDQLALSLKSDFAANESVLYSGRPWAADYSTYQKLAEISEYAAWVYAHGYRPNHFTVYVNHLKKLNQIQDLNAFLKQNGFPLNAAGGEIKGTPAEYLEQSSTMANQVPVKFADGVYTIPGCYYEFAKRYTLPNGSLFKGFIAQSANKIFESTNKLSL